MLACGLLVLAFTLGGGPASIQPSLPAQPRPGMMRLVLVFDEKDGRRLEGVQDAAPESTPPLDGYTLFERGKGRDRKLGERVGAAAYAPDGTVLFVERDVLVEWRDGRRRKVVEGVLPDFACNADCSEIAVARGIAFMETSIDRVRRSDGAVRAVLSEGRGWNGLPVFTPDGRSVVFSSNRDGDPALYRVDADGKGLERLIPPGRAEPPPIERRRDLRFRDANTLSFRAAGETWAVDLSKRSARKLEEPAR